MSDYKHLRFTKFDAKETMTICARFAATGYCSICGQKICTAAQKTALFRGKFQWRIMPYAAISKYSVRKAKMGVKLTGYGRHVRPRAPVTFLLRV